MKKFSVALFLSLLLVCGSLLNVFAASSFASRSDTNRGRMTGSTSVGLVGNVNNYRRATVSTTIALQPKKLTVSGTFRIVNGGNIGYPKSSQEYVTSVSAQSTYPTSLEIRCTTSHTMEYNGATFRLTTEDTYR